MRIGIDFDNTIVCYDQVFHQVAKERGLIPSEVSVSKEAIRDHLRRQGREDAWTEMQGYVYGARMADAELFSGVSEFFEHCRQNGVETCIISHKTRLPFSGPAYDLHEAAQWWLKGLDFMNAAPAELRPRVFLELTKEDKLRCIGTKGCDYFIDDLPEFLLDPGFPQQVRRIHFDPRGAHVGAGHPFPRASSWREIQQMIL